MSFSLFCHTEETIKTLPTENQTLLQVLRETLSDETLPLKEILPFDSKQNIWRILATLGYHMKSELFEYMEEDDSLEMWNSDFKFIFAMGKVMAHTSYTNEDLATKPWVDLFDRDVEVSSQIVKRWRMALETNQVQEDVSDWHLVTETQSEAKKRFYIKVKTIIPYENRHSGQRGIFALVKFKQPVGVLGLIKKSQ